jgi:glycosyltransferase involved in cell wall biosynthesis
MLPMTNAEQPLVSVVTPFFNAEPFLAGCIESVLAQTYRHFEYILANNCSTDRSVEIVERYAARDSRIRLLHNERFLPQLQNYNQALSQISPSSRYFKMVQADDEIFPRCLEEMVAVAEANPSVGVVSSYRMVGKGIGPLGLPRTKCVMSGREAGRVNLVDDLYLFGSQTTVMVRSDIVRARRPFYTEASFFADSDAVYEILADHDFAFVHQVLTYSRVDQDSINGQAKSYNPPILDRLIRLKSYGPMYLSPEEHVRYLREHRRAYRLFLAEAWLRRREAAFWEFHCKGLARIDEEIDRSRFLLDAVPVIVHYALRPGTVARWVLRRTRRLLESRA